MGRRKQYMDDGDDSSDEEGGRIRFDITDRDLEEEAEGFYGSRSKRKRFGDDDDDLDEDESDIGRGGLGSGFSMANMVNFKPSTTQSTPSPGTSRSSTPSKEAPKRPRQQHNIRPAEDFAKFTSHGTGFGKRMLEKMGWRMGQGLGEEGAGIINPIETKLRPKGMGMGFRGFSEQTQQAKEEAKRQHGGSTSEEEGEELSDDNQQRQQQPKREAWKRKTRKPKTVYKTAAAIIADTAEQGTATGAVPATQQKVIDMRGPTVREVSLADLERESPSWQETTTRLPELRHNLRLIVDLARGDLENLARDRTSNELRLKALEEDCSVIQKRREVDTARRDKVIRVKEMAQELQSISKSALASGAYEQANITALFGDVFERMIKEYTPEDIRSLHLDQIVVAVWTPVMKYKTSRWDVLADPTWGAKDVLAWRQLLLANDDDERAFDSDFVVPRRPRKEIPNATPFEMMMNTVWLVRVRTAINNTWNVRDPEPIVQLLEAWKPPLLPTFIFENIVNQLILPKISRAVDEWDPRNDPEMVHTWIHPWLPVLEAWRLAELFTNIRHKLSVILRVWHPSDESALHIITPWKGVWTDAQMETFLGKAILPKLKRVLRDEFVVNPRDQQLDPLIWVLAWRDLVSEATLSQLIEKEFFGKWLDVLYKWLTLSQDRINYDEVREWYLWWRQVLETYGFADNKTISACFRKGLDMMAAAASGEPVVKSS